MFHVAVSFVAFLVEVCFVLVFVTPMWFIWNALAGYYFPMLPEAWKYIPFWDAIGFLLFFSLVREVIRGQRVTMKGKR